MSKEIMVISDKRLLIYIITMLIMLLIGSHILITDNIIINNIMYMATGMAISGGILINE